MAAGLEPVKARRAAAPGARARESRLRRMQQPRLC